MITDLARRCILDYYAIYFIGNNSDHKAYRTIAIATLIFELALDAVWKRALKILDAHKCIKIELKPLDCATLTWKCTIEPN